MEIETDALLSLGSGKVFGHGIWWIGLSTNLRGYDVRILKMAPLGREANAGFQPSGEVAGRHDDAGVRAGLITSVVVVALDF